MKRIMFLVLLFLPFTTTFALVFGVTANYPPFSSLADKQNHFYGFEPDIIQAICSRIHESCQFKPMVVNDIPSALLSNTIDFAAAAIIIPSKPNPLYLFSLPYLTSSVQALIEKNSKIKKNEDLIGKTIGIRRFFGVEAFKEFLLKRWHNQITIQEYPGLGELTEALNDHIVDAVITNSAAIEFWAINNSNTYALVGEKIPYGNGYGIMTHLGNEVLINRINQAINDMMKDGTYLTIYSRYFQ